MDVFCAVSGCFSTAYKHDKGVSFHRFHFGNAILLNLVSFVKNLLFNSVLLVTVFTVARCAGGKKYVTSTSEKLNQIKSTLLIVLLFCLLPLFC